MVIPQASIFTNYCHEYNQGVGVRVQKLRVNNTISSETKAEGHNIDCQSDSDVSYQRSSGSVVKARPETRSQKIHYSGKDKQEQCAVVQGRNKPGSSLEAEQESPKQG